MDEILADYALSRILDDPKICEWATAEVGKRVGYTNSDDCEFWVTYTTIINELLDVIRKKNEPLQSDDT